MSEAQQRAAVVNESLTWLRTPFHHEARVKGAGVDCLHFIIEVFVTCGLMIRPIIPHYPQDIMLHRNEETYLEGLLLYTKEVATPQPGDIALWKFGRIFSHGAIVIEWPRIIHAHRLEGGVVLADGPSGERADRQVKFFTMWNK